VVRDIRLETASRLLATTREPFSIVARRCGFSSREALRQASVARFGLAPSCFRDAHTRSPLVASFADHR
jgi:transcriptional regulator GlxA family with amidase domain